MSQTHSLKTTTFELPGYRVVKSFGVMRGIIFQSRSVVGNIGAGIHAIFGGHYRGVVIRNGCVYLACLISDQYRPICAV